MWPGWRSCASERYEEMTAGELFRTDDEQVPGYAVALCAVRSNLLPRSAREHDESRGMKRRRATQARPPLVGAQVALARAATGLGWMSLGALAVGATAVGAVAIGALAIRALAIKRGRIGRLDIEELEVGRLRVRELIVEQRHEPQAQHEGEHA